MSFINWGSESPEQLAIRRQLEEQAIYEQAVRTCWPMPSVGTP